MRRARRRPERNDSRQGNHCTRPTTTHHPRRSMCPQDMKRAVENPLGRMRRVDMEPAPRLLQGT